MLEEWRRRTARSGLEIVMINIWEGVGSEAEAAAFCDLWQIDGTVLVDEPGHYADQLGVRGVPMNVFIDDGLITGVTGPTPDDLATEIHRLLGPEAPIDDA
jgi:predicted DsbA family dithiol-disulfide isomerase